MSRDVVNEMRRFWEEAFNGRDLSLLGDLIADDYVNHAALLGTPPGPAGQAAVMQRLWAAIPDARFEITHLAVDGDVVICIGTMSGTHDGELLGVPASGRRVEWRMCHLMRFDADGRAIEHRAIRDDLGLMRQMGALQSADLLLRARGLAQVKIWRFVAGHFGRRPARPPVVSLPYSVVHIDALERSRLAEAGWWRPVRRSLGITAFGANAYTADAGEPLIESHDERGPGAGGHEELYIVLTRP